MTEQVREEEKCEECGNSARHHDSEGVPLCHKCWLSLCRDTPMPDLRLGDLTIVDSGDLGLDFFDLKGNKLMFVNAISEEAIRDWLTTKLSKNKRGK